MDQIDLEVLPKGQRAWKAFAQAAGAVDDSAERYFLELKSDVDLSTKSGRAKVSKFILGALNRMPDHAARRFEGHALMVLGVAHNAITGIAAFEALDLDRDVQKFAGAAVRARWDYHTVPTAEGRSVVIIQVSPPRWGDRPLVCRADGEGLLAGEVYVRADGNTRKATAGELDQLHDRLSGGVSAEPYVQLSGVHRLSVDQADVREAFEQHLKTTADELLASLAPSVGLLGSRAYGGIDTRSIDRFHDEVESWVSTSTSAFTSVLRLVACSRPTVQVIVGVCESQSVLAGVEVDIHFGEEVQVFPYAPLTRRELFRLLPDPPAAYGENSVVSARQIVRQIVGSQIGEAHQSKLYPIGTDGRLVWSESSPRTISVRFNDVRPTKARHSLDDQLILVTDASPDTTAIVAHWTITALGHDRIYRGELAVPIVDIDLTETLRRVLGLTSS